MDLRTPGKAPQAGVDSADTGPILLIPYMWIGDFVRCHTAIQLLKARFPRRPIDVLTNALPAPLLDYMPGVRRGLATDLPRGRLALAKQRDLAKRMRAEGYGTAIVMPRTWKSALAPMLAGIPERTGFFGEGRLLLLNDIRWGERKLYRMVDRFVALVVPKGAPIPEELPLPHLELSQAEVVSWISKRELDSGRPAAALCPGAVGTGKRWPNQHYGELARRLVALGINVWVLGGPNERPLARDIQTIGGDRVHDLTGRDLREAIFALKAAKLAVSNDSGLLHIAAALDTPAVGIFGPTDPKLWAPLNPIAVVEPPPGPCPTCHRRDCAEISHRRTDDISVEQVADAASRILGSGR
jgi:heptosyltransferase-2